MDRLQEILEGAVGETKGKPSAGPNSEFVSVFARVLIAESHLIPTDEQLAARRSEKKRAEEERRAAQEAREKRERIEAAAPELLAALRRLHDAYIYDGGVPGDPYMKLRLLLGSVDTWKLWEDAEAAIQRAERGHE